MTRIASSPIVILAVVLTFLGGGVIFAQDKYTVQVPGGLAFSVYCGPVLRHSAELIQAANFRSAVVF